MKLDQREKLLLILAIAIFSPLIIFRYALQPIQEYQTKQVAKISTLKKKTNQINLLGQELAVLKRENKPQSISLGKRIDGMLRRSKLKSRSSTITEAQPGGGQRLILKLNELNLSELYQLLYKIENTKPGILIENIDISPSYQNKKLFRLSMALSSK